MSSSVTAVEPGLPRAHHSQDSLLLRCESRDLLGGNGAGNHDDTGGVTPRFLFCCGDIPRKIKSFVDFCGGATVLIGNLYGHIFSEHLLVQRGTF